MSTFSPADVATSALAVCRDIARLQAQVAFAFDDLLGTHHGIAYAEFQLLDELARAPHGRLRRNELAARLGLSAAGVTRALLPLEKIGLVGREVAPDGPRVTQVALSAAGRQVLREAETSALGAACRTLRCADARRLDRAQRLLAELAARHPQAGGRHA
jgi:DNA-binding MarR family transcriptional regulator